MRDMMGNTVCYVVIDRKRKTAEGRWWRVATFREEANAQAFLAEQANPNLVVSCNQATVADLRLARD